MCYEVGELKRCVIRAVARVMILSRLDVLWSGTKTILIEAVSAE